MMVPVFPHLLLTLVVFCVCVHFLKVILASVKWYLIVVSIFTSLTISDVEYFCMFLLAIAISSSEKCLFKPFADFLVVVVLLLLLFSCYPCPI